MSKILIYKNVIPNGEYDIFNMIDFRKVSDTVKTSYDYSCPNIGNRAWLQGIIVALNDGNNYIELLDPNMTSDYINANFDYVVLPMANIFYSGYISALNYLADVFEKIKIPTYVIACGVQASSYSRLNDVIEAIKEPATRFIRSIYATGGEFALRGYFTKEFFDKLGFKSAVVTGCPSLYQLGEGLKILKDNDIKSIKPVLNGKMSIVEKYLSEEPSAIYIDQCDFFNLVFAVRDDNKYNSDKKYIKSLIKQYGFDLVKYAMDFKILFFTDISLWRNYLIDNEFNFSFGTRIHGNIISILSGIPALMCACDSRTREMAEFFSISIIKPSEKKYPLEDLYDMTDYTSFNNKFKENYYRFEEFLISAGLVKQIGKYNMFFKQKTDSDYLSFVKSLLEPYRAEFITMEKGLYLLDQGNKLKAILKRILKNINR